VFPDTENSPASRHKYCVSLTVTLFVACEFSSPEIGVRMGDDEMIGAAVPEATIDKHGETFTREHEIGGSPDSRNRTRAHTEAQSTAVCSGSEAAFRKGIPPTRRDHRVPGVS